MRIFAIDLGTMMIRYYLMMAIIIVSVFIGQPLLCLLALPVFLSANLGVFPSVKNKKDFMELSKTKSSKSEKIVKEAA